MSSGMDQNALVYSAQLQLKKYGSFINDYHAVLLKLGEKLDSKHSAGLVTTSTERTEEAITTNDVVDSDNKILRKIILSFSEIYKVKEVLKEAQDLLMNFVLMDENLAELELRHSDWERPTQLFNVDFGKILELLFRIKFFLEHVTRAATEIVTQLGALFECEKQYVKTSQSIHFQSVFHYLADLVVVIVKFEEVLRTAGIKNYWPFLKQSLNSVKYNLQTFDNKYDFATVQGVESVLVELESLLVRNQLDQLLRNVAAMREKLNKKALGVFLGHFLSFLKTTLSEIQRYGADLVETEETSNIMKVTVMICVHQHLFGSLEKKILKNVTEIHVKHPVLTVFGNVLWAVDAFLKRHLPGMLKGYDKYPAELEKARTTTLNARTSTIQRDARNYFLLVSVWTFEMKEAFGGDLEHNSAEVKRQSALLLQGFTYAGQISQMIKSTVNLFVHLSVPMTLTTLTAICKLIELLQIIQITFEDQKSRINQVTQLILQQLLFKILTVVSSAKKKYLDSSMNDRKLDIVAALNICEKALFGAPSGKRVFIARLALGASEPTKVFEAADLQTLESCLRDAEKFMLGSELLEELCDFSFLYWHQSIVPLHMKHVMEARGNPERLKFVLRAVDSCYRSVWSRKSEIVEDSTLANLKTYHWTALRETVIQKICQHLETFLRLDFHSNLQVDNYNPFLSNNPEYFVTKALARLESMQVFGKEVLLKDHVEQYLNATFYNLTTISLHDWKSYGEMRHLARFKFGLDTTDDFLPTLTIEQGLDILEILRNMNVFVTKYLYNLNNQIFIEQYSNNKHVNTININHVANSLRAHGVGIVNTTVNFTYQFLRNKFQVFSQFLFDEQIKSRLMKEAKFFGNVAADSTVDSKPYTYERAESFARNLRKLGLNSQGLSYLDMLRVLVSHVGNALGYVRLVRSGAIRFCADASVSVPVLDKDLQFVFLAKEDNLEQRTLESAEALENTVEKLNKTFAEGVEYFKLLVDTFAPFFRNPKHVHLRHFYLIVPALMMNYVEYMLTAKDKMSKKDKSGALFTDDGFCIGLAYVLKLLDQINAFNSLHWFKSLKHKYRRDRQELVEKRDGHVSVDEKLQQTFALTEKRIKSFQQEYDLLYYNLSSAKIFFQ